MDKKFEIIVGENKEDPLSRVLRMGGFAVDVTKRTIKFGLLFAGEVGNTVMYTSGQKAYARALERREPIDRVIRELKTATRAFTKKQPDIELGTFASMLVVSASETVAERNVEKAKEQAPAIAELIDAIPATPECESLAELMTARCFGPIVDDFNKPLLQFRHPLPTQRGPAD